MPVGARACFMHVFTQKTVFLYLGPGRVPGLRRAPRGIRESFRGTQNPICWKSTTFHICFKVQYIRFKFLKFVLNFENLKTNSKKEDEFKIYDLVSGFKTNSFRFLGIVISFLEIAQVLKRFEVQNEFEKLRTKFQKKTSLIP